MGSEAVSPASSDSRRIPVRWFLAAPPPVLFALLMTAVVSVVVFGVSEIAAGYVNDYRLEAQRLTRTAQHLATVHESVLQAESAQRGFLLTSDRRYLEPFNRATQKLQLEAVGLGAATRDDPETAKRVDDLIRLATQRLDELRLTVANAEAGRIEQALAMVQAGYGIQLMEELIPLAVALEDETLGKLQQRTHDIQQSLVRQRIAVGVMVLLSLAFLAMLAKQLIHQFVQREGHRKELEAQSALLEQQVAARTEELSSLSSYLQASTERDKSRLARDLHDELGGILTSAKLDVAWLQGHAKNADPEVMPRLTRLAQVLDEAVDLKRRVVENLRPSLLDHLGLVAALNWYVTETCTKAGLQAELEFPDDEERVPPEIAIAIYRLVQEGLTNTIKYAHATSVRISLKRDARGWVLRLADNGVGIANFRPENLSHGIAGMRQRARALGGTFVLTTAAGAGVTIETAFPLRE